MAQPNIALAPVNSALNTSIQQLLRCENTARTIYNHIHGTQPEPANLTKERPEEYVPEYTSSLSNTLAARIESLAVQLETIAGSF